MTETGIQARAKREMTRAVLVVDDDPFIRRLIVTTLEDVADFEIHEAACRRPAELTRWSRR